jgi:ribosomal protein S6
MYEISFILKEENMAPVRKVFSGRGVDVSGEGELRKVRMAYPIKKNEYGFFGSFEFETASENLDKIFGDLKLEEGVLRYMVIRAEEMKAKRKETKKTPEVASLAGRVDEPKHRPESVLTNEELEKKIEEILQ